MDLHADRKKKKMLRENRKKNNMAHLNLPTEERNEQAIQVLNQKMEVMMGIINQQQKTMDMMHKEIMGRLNEVYLPNNLSDIIEEKEVEDTVSRNTSQHIQKQTERGKCGG